MKKFIIKPTQRKYFKDATKHSKKWGLENEFKMFYKQHRKKKTGITQSVTNALVDWDLI